MQRFSRYENLHCAAAKNIRISNLPSNLIQHLDLINLKHAISYRDELIAAHLKNLGVTEVIDIGCDFGNLLNTCENLGIKAKGYDIDPNAVESCRNSNLTAEIASFNSIAESPEQYLKFDYNLDETDEKSTAISILNVIGGKWKDLRLRKRLIVCCIERADFFIITADKRLLKRILKEFSLQVVTFLGPQSKTLPRYFLTFLQYGHPLFLRNSNFEMRFWQKLTMGKRSFQDRISAYTRHSVILKKK